MLSHVDENNQAKMVDVSEKIATRRTARAQSTVLLPAAIGALFVDDDIQSKKGPVFQTARIAGIMAAKKTSELIPFCHPLALEDCRVEISFEEGSRVLIDCYATVTAKTGVEMEALTGATVAALTVYDMCKAMSHDIVIERTVLVEKRGGKSDYAREA